jgi:hypothetical protein
MTTQEQLTDLREKLITVTNKINDRSMAMDVEVGELDDISDKLQEVILSL